MKIFLLLITFIFSIIYMLFINREREISHSSTDFNNKLNIYTKIYSIFLLIILTMYILV